MVGTSFKIQQNSLNNIGKRKPELDNKRVDK